MKKFACLALLASISSTALAAASPPGPLPSPPRDETLFGPGDFHVGYFGAPVLKAAEVQGNWALLLGGRGGVVLGHTLAFGVGGYICTEFVNQDIYTYEGPPDLLFMYGGLEVEYVLFSHKLVHATGQALIGGGSLVEEQNDEWYHHGGNQIYDGFFVVEPGVSVELNVLSFFRVAVGAGYLYVNGVELEGLANEDFSGPTAMVQFKFGSF